MHRGLDARLHCWGRSVLGRDEHWRRTQGAVYATCMTTSDFEERIGPRWRLRRAIAADRVRRWIYRVVPLVAARASQRDAAFQQQVEWMMRTGQSRLLLDSNPPRGEYRSDLNRRQ
jgi:hypothetical protein